MPKRAPSLDVRPVPHPSGALSYVVVDPASREAAVVDPLLDRLGETLRLLGAAEASLRWIVETHAHGDHLSGAAALHARTGAEVVASVAADTRVATRRVADGDALPLGERELAVRATPGVAPDAIVLVGAGGGASPVVFTGDTLLVGTVGVRDAPGADPAAHFESVQRVFEALPDDAVVHPGHDDMGRTVTTMRAERRGNRWMREKDREAYVARWNADPRTAPREASEILAANRDGSLEPPPEVLEAVERAAGARPREGAGGHATSGSGMQTPTSMATAGSGVRVTEGVGQLLVAGGLVVAAATALGFLVDARIHAVSGLVGAAAVVVGGVAGARRKPKAGAGLYYLGPLPRTPSR